MRGSVLEVCRHGDGGVTNTFCRRYTITIPAGVPACDPCVLRWVCASPPPASHTRPRIPALTLLTSPAKRPAEQSLPGYEARLTVPPPLLALALSQEWYAVQQVTNIEFYSQCTDVRVVNPLGTGAVLSGTVSIGVTTGFEHLPAVRV
jgi:hypothetical protein